MPRADDLETIDAALTRIGRVANSRRAAGERARRSGINLPPTALATLAAVYRLGPARLTAIADQVDLEPSRISREVTRLVAEGLVDQAPDPDDGRATSLTATPKGRSAFERYRAVADEMLAEQVADWTDDEVAALAAALVRFSGSLTFG